MLKNKLHSPLHFVPNLIKRVHSRQQHPRMAIMPASVHNPFIHRFKVKVGFFLKRQGIIIGPHANHFAGPPALQHRNNPRFGRLINLYLRILLQLRHYVSVCSQTPQKKSRDADASAFSKPKASRYQSCS
jgi:hypothetical protein